MKDGYFSLRQRELADWQHNNFGENPDRIYHLVLGMVEEVGETAHHVLKGKQKIRGGMNGIDVEKVADGVVDTMVYGIQLLTEIGVDAEEAFTRIVSEVLSRNWKDNPSGDGKQIQGGVRNANL